MELNKSLIRFHYLTTPFHFPRRTLIKEQLLLLFKEHSRRIEAINYIFCSDEYLLKLNQDFLQHNYYTDVITFELNKREDPVLSDVYISVDRAKENAQKFQVSLFQELMRLLIHSSLHLCGFKDKSATETAEMRLHEEFYLKRLVSRETS